MVHFTAAFFESRRVAQRMILSLTAVVLGLALLLWSADRFVDGSAAAARHFKMPPLLIGMVIVGFGTSMPEMIVSVISSYQNNPGIAVGNAYGSNITNILMILGLTALIRPITVQSGILRRQMPILAVVTILAAWQMHDGSIGRPEASVLLIVFAGLMTWTILQGRRRKDDALGLEVAQAMTGSLPPLGLSLLRLGYGLVLLIVSSRILVWGAIAIARMMGVGDLLIGLTIVAIGTSLPELASSLVAARRGEHDIALGNVLGSNLFNTLAVVGIAGLVRPLNVGPEVFSRDIPVMATATLALFVVGFGFRGAGRINRIEGGLMLVGYIGYTAYLVSA